LVGMDVMGGQFTRLVMSLLPLVLAVIVFYVVFKLVFLGEPPKSKPADESYGHLRQ